MDEKKKQIVLVAVLAVLGLGWGSYYFFIRDTGVVENTAMNTGPVERKARKDVEDSKKAPTRRRAKARAPKEEKVAPTRKVRDVSERDTSTRRKTRRAKETKVKKKKIVPAA